MFSRAGRFLFSFGNRFWISMQNLCNWSARTHKMFHQYCSILNRVPVKLKNGQKRKMFFVKNCILKKIPEFVLAYIENIT